MSKSAEAIIADARRVEAFLHDEAIGGETGALTRMERRYYEEFLAADTSEKRVTAWAKAKMLKDLEREMRSIIGAGEQEMLNVARAAKPKSL